MVFQCSFDGLLVQLAFLEWVLHGAVVFPAIDIIAIWAPRAAFVPAVDLLPLALADEFPM